MLHYTHLKHIHYTFVLRLFFRSLEQNIFVFFIVSSAVCCSACKCVCYVSTRLFKQSLIIPNVSMMWRWYVVCTPNSWNANARSHSHVYCRRANNTHALDKFSNRFYANTQATLWGITFTFAKSAIWFCLSGWRTQTHPPTSHRRSLARSFVRFARRCTQFWPWLVVADLRYAVDMLCGCCCCPACWPCVCVCVWLNMIS